MVVSSRERNEGRVKECMKQPFIERLAAREMQKTVHFGNVIKVVDCSMIEQDAKENVNVEKQRDRRGSFKTSRILCCNSDRRKREYFLGII